MIINIKVKPRSSKSEIVEIEKNKEYLANLKSEPENNKANIELIGLVAKYFNISFNKVRIVRGLKSKNKIAEIKE